MINKNVFTNEEIDEIKKEVSKLLNEPDRKDFIWKYYEAYNKDLVNRIEYFVKFSPLLKKISEKFLKEDYILMKDKINFKYPQGEGFIAHQDITAGWGKYGKNHINIAIPLQETNIENGCLYIADINEKKMLTPERTDLSDDIVHPNLYKPVITKKGDIIKFDSYTPHKSFKNNTQEPRIIIYFTYVQKDIYHDESVYEDYHRDKFNAVPPDIYKVKGKEYRCGNTNVLRKF